MKSSITKVLLVVTVLSALTHSSVGLLAAPVDPVKSEKPKAPVLSVDYPSMVPDGVADAAGQTMYLRSSGGGIDAIEVATGKSKWTTKDLAKPLIVIANRFAVPYPAHLIVQVPVAGQENALKIGIWESTTGRQIILSDAVVFPDWVVVAAEDGAIYGKYFSAQTSVQGNTLSLTWQASTHYAGGAAPPPEVEAAARNEGAGVLRVNLKTGKVQPTQISIVSGPFRPLQPIPGNALVSIDEKYVLTPHSPEATEGKTGLWTVTNRENSKTAGKIELGESPESIAIVGTKIFWVTSIQPEGGHMMGGEILRELNVAEIVTGKLLWKRTLKPQQIMPLPM